MNKKGQTLVAFILILPLIMIMIGFVVDYTYVSFEVRKTNNVVKSAVKYGLNDDKSETEIRKYLNDNLDELIDIEIKNNDMLDISVKKDIKGKYSILRSGNIKTLISHYKGYLNDGKVVILKGV
jgi:hypothetical protein